MTRRPLLTAYALLIVAVAAFGAHTVVGRVAASDIPPLALTFWRFGAFERFQRRLVPWEEYNRGAARVVDPAELEPGDYLLAWGESGESLRYCHYADASETEQLVESLHADRAAASVATIAEAGIGNSAPTPF